MIAVADASPVCYAVLIGEVDLLARLFSRVVLPRPVLCELLGGGAPTTVRAGASSLPAWAPVYETPSSVPIGLEHLHAGERAAFFATEPMKADIVILDEKTARPTAAERGLRVTGLLGILAEAANRGLVDIASAVGKLRTTGFRCSPALLKSVLDRYRSN